MSELAAVSQLKFQSLLDTHANIVFKVANTYCWHVEDRRDLAQEIRAQLWQAFPSYDDSRSFSTWMYRVALNVAISHVRKASLRNKHAGEIPTADVADPRQDLDAIDDRAALLQRFIASLDPLNRALLLLYLEERSYADISVVLGISATNVATKLHRLKARIRMHVVTSVQSSRS